jgi:nucleoside-diphosphate-sugar epimerase
MNMNKRIFVAGATGAIGIRMCRLLVADGYAVVGTTRVPEKTAMLKALGVEPVVVDVFDADRLRELVVASRPDVVVHQLTDLPPGLDPAKMADARIRNARLREIGTKNLVDAAVAAGAPRIVAQSIAFACVPGPLPYDESVPLNVDAIDDAARMTARAVASLEQQVLAGPFAGIVLRYGKLYGPGTGFEIHSSGAPVHVDAAADAARRAIDMGDTGIYNIAEDDGTLLIAKARQTLKWDPAFRIHEQL